MLWTLGLPWKRPTLEESVHRCIVKCVTGRQQYLSVDPNRPDEEGVLSDSGIVGSMIRKACFGEFGVVIGLMSSGKARPLHKILGRTPDFLEWELDSLKLVNAGVVETREQSGLSVLFSLAKCTHHPIFHRRILVGLGPDV